jgi:hypothetical protein
MRILSNEVLSGETEQHLKINRIVKGAGRYLNWARPERKPQLLQLKHSVAVLWFAFVDVPISQSECSILSPYMRDMYKY